MSAGGVIARWPSERQDSYSVSIYTAVLYQCLSPGEQTAQKLHALINPSHLFRS